jgi:hypothetical protein
MAIGIVWKLVKNIGTVAQFEERINRNVLAEAERLSGRYLDEYRKRVDTWNDPPSFSAKVDGDVRGDRPDIVINIEGTEFQRQKWRWINDGTAIRYATMSKDFQAKTAPGRRVSTAGAGQVLFVKKSVPRPGIKARNFERDINEQLEPTFVDRARRAILRGLNGS